MHYEQHENTKQLAYTPTHHSLQIRIVQWFKPYINSIKIQLFFAYITYYTKILQLLSTKIICIMSYLDEFCQITI